MKSLLYIILSLLICGCSYSGIQTEKLNDAQHLLKKDPKTALDKLIALDISEFQDSATIARWALLYSEALIANRLNAPTDTIINVAVEYYGNHHLTPEYQHAVKLKSIILSSPDNHDALGKALYIQKEKEFLLYKERATRKQYIIIFIGIALIATILLIWLRQKLKLTTLHNDALIAEASMLKHRIETNKQNEDKLENTLHNLLDNRFALIDSLCQTYYESQGSKTERKSLADKVKNEIENIRNNAFSEMEHAVNACRANMLNRLKETIPHITQEDYRLSVLLACGLSNRTISLLLDCSIDNVYKRKSRLKSRLKESLTSSHTDIMETLYPKTDS